MKFLAIILAIVVTQVQCRSVMLSNTKDIDVDRNARVYRDAKQDAFQTIGIDVPRDSLNLTNEKIVLYIPGQLKELVTAYKENFAKLVKFAIKLIQDKDINKQQIQVFHQLGLLIEQIIKEQSKTGSVNVNNVTDSILQTANSKSMININNLKDLINAIKENNIIYKDERAIEEHNEATSFVTSEDMLDQYIN